MNRLIVKTSPVCKQQYIHTISVNICVTSILQVCDSCACALQVRRSWPCSGSSDWQQAHAPDGAPAFLGHGVRSGSVRRKILTCWSALNALLAASLMDPNAKSALLSSPTAFCTDILPWIFERIWHPRPMGATHNDLLISDLVTLKALCSQWWMPLYTGHASRTYFVHHFLTKEVDNKTFFGE